MTDIQSKAKQIQLFLTDVDGILTDAGMYYTENGDELKKFSTLDGGGFLLLHYAGIRTGILTSEKTGLVERRARKLNIEFVLQGERNKLDAFNKLLARIQLAPEAVAYIGDDINDIPVLKVAGISASVPSHCLPPDFALDYVTQRSGGAGAVRDFAEWLLHQRGDYDKALSLYLKERTVE